MNKLLLPLCLTILLPSCSSYRIEGSTSVPSLDGQKLYLKVPHQDSFINLDSCEVIHGLFNMDGEVDSVILGAIYLCGESLMPVVVEKGRMKISIENSGLKVSGTTLNDRLYDFIYRKNLLEQNLSDVQHKQMQLIMDGISADEAERQIQAETKELIASMDKLVTEFVTANFDNLLALQVFAIYCQSLPQPVITPTIQQILDKAPETFKEEDFVKEYLRLATQQK